MIEFDDLPDLAAARLGGRVLAANDEFFAEKENLLKAEPAIWIADRYTDQGKWMDGWETRRRRTPGYDWAILRLGLPGIVRGVVIDTSWFTGNYPEYASLDACEVEGPSPPEPESAAWKTLLPKSALQGNTSNRFELDGVPQRVTHLRLNIFPDGGVARLRVHGEAVPSQSIFAPDRELDLAALANGGLVIDASD